MKTLKFNFIISGTKIALPFEAICSVTDKKFSGDVIIEYQPQDRVLEYVEIEKELIGCTRKKITAEELANNIFNLVKEAISPSYLKILVDVKHSDAHKPVEVWIERKLGA